MLSNWWKKPNTAKLLNKTCSHLPVMVLQSRRKHKLESTLTSLRYRTSLSTLVGTFCYALTIVSCGQRLVKADTEGSVVHKWWKAEWWEESAYLFTRSEATPCFSICALTNTWCGFPHVFTLAPAHMNNVNCLPCVYVFVLFFSFWHNDLQELMSPKETVGLS